MSLALGAFFAGTVLSESELSHRAAEESLPLRDAFAVLFFVSVGMLFDPLSLVRDPLLLLAVLFIVIVGKSMAAFLIVLAFRHPVGTELTISANLASHSDAEVDHLAGLGANTVIMGEQEIADGMIAHALPEPARMLSAAAGGACAEGCHSGG